MRNCIILNPDDQHEKKVKWTPEFWDRKAAERIVHVLTRLGGKNAMLLMSH